MTELVERYVHQVGRYLPSRERAEIEAELRSMIEDQLSDRFADAPTQAEVASVLATLGDPRQMAASYGSQRYLVGPDLYPYMLDVLRNGWLSVPAIVVFLNVFGALIASEPKELATLVGETLLGVVQATAIFSALVVLVFAIVQHTVAACGVKRVFDPLTLPAVGDPATVDRSEALWGSVFGLLVNLLFLYFLAVGGLTLRFDLTNPGEVIPVPKPWLVVLIALSLSMIALQMVALWRNRWTAGLWLLETVLEVVGTVGLYFVLYRPLFERLVAANPGLMDVPVVQQLPEILAALTVISTVVSRGGRALRLLNHRQSPSHQLASKPDA